MTAIIAIKDGKRIMIGADSYNQSGKIIGVYKSVEEFKVHKIIGSDHCYIGGAGSASLNKAIRQTPNLLDGKDDVSLSYMVKVVVPKILALASRNDGLIKTKEEHYRLNGSLIITTKNHIYQINSYGEVIDAKYYAGIGSGSPQTNATFYQINGRKDLSIEDKMLACLRNSIKTGPCIGYPIVMYSNDSDEVKIYNE